MKRRFLKERDAFPKSVDEYNRQVERRLRHRRAELDAAWEALEEGWKQNNERMEKLEVRPRTDEESVVNLNVGGSNVAVSWHLLAETKGFKCSVLGALLEGVWAKGRIPRDCDGRIVLDESPACVEHIIHNMLCASSGAVGAARSAVAADEVPCLMYTAHEMALPGFMPTYPKYPEIIGGSTILEAFELASLSCTVRQWFAGSAEPLTLIYRATRDGFGSKAFTARCNASTSKTVSLIRVRSGQGNNVDSVVGGYACFPWGSAVGSSQVVSKETFVFKLKDGIAAGKDACKPTMWHPKSGYVGKEFVVPRSDGPYFCAGDLAMNFDEKSGGCTMQTKQNQYHFPTGSSSLFLALNGKKVVDIEVYRYSTPAPPTTTAPSTTKPGGDALTGAEVHDIRSFGQSIANSLMEERVVLDRAVKEMEAAGARVSTAVRALETVYGPSVAAGEQDAVVDLNVRGTRMTTLRSTLQACPRSALAAMFNEERWPATDKDKDQHGGRLIDCNPTYFSKILDALRMRKRASWSRSAAGGREEKESSGVLRGGVLIKQADAGAFVKAVNMYFPGCESFIADLVQQV